MEICFILPFENAQPLTNRVRGVMILEDYEWFPGDKNDLMIDAYNKFKKLGRAQELKNRKLRADKSLSEAEEELLKDLTGDKALAPFLGN